MREVTIDTLVDVGAALAHPGRLRILAMLREGDLCVCQMTSVVRLAFSTMSNHLAILRRAGLVTEEKRGRWVHYRLAEEEPLGSLVREILHLVNEDRQILEDGRVIGAVRRIPLEDLCRAGLNLKAVGIKGNGGRRGIRPSSGRGGGRPHATVSRPRRL